MDRGPSNATGVQTLQWREKEPPDQPLMCGKMESGALSGVWSEAGTEREPVWALL